MSTGLTYVQFNDANGTDPNASTALVFADYNEAKQYALWLTKWTYTYIAGADAKCTIWTSGPNDNGFTFIFDGNSYFSAFD